MEYIKPLQLLEEKLLEYEKALHKSFTAYQAKQITEEEHNTHKKNLNPKIFEYRQAINTLKTWQ